MRSNMPERHPKPMSTVPPSPACPMTLVVAVALGPQRRRDAGRHRRRIAEEGVEPGDLPRGLGVGGREHLEAPGRVHRHHLPAGGAHGGIERIAGAESLSAALAGPVPRGEGVGPLGARLDGAALDIDEPVADGEAARPGRSGPPSSADPRCDGAQVPEHVLGRGPGPPALRHALRAPARPGRVQVEEGQPAELAPDRRPRRLAAAMPW